MMPTRRALLGAMLAAPAVARVPGLASIASGMGMSRGAWV